MMCLNPYCAGIWSRRLINHSTGKSAESVLILIVLEYGLGDCMTTLTWRMINVLILIVLEYGLGEIRY